MCRETRNFFCAKTSHRINILGQLQKAVEMLKNYPSVNLFLGDSFWTNIEMLSIAHCQTIAYVSKDIENY